MQFLDMTLGEMLEKQVSTHPDRDFMVYADRDLRFTYRGFNQRVDRLAKGLMAIGLRKGDHLGIWATNVPDWLTVLFATAKIGVVLVTVNTAYRTHELEYLIQQSDMSTLCLINGFRDSDYVAMVNELIPELKTCQRGHLCSERFPRLRNVIFLDRKSTAGCTAPRSCCSWASRCATRRSRRPRKASPATR